MIQAFDIKNFKSFKHARLPLSPLTVLIGPNASGKSNAIEALQLLSWLSEGRQLGDLQGSVREQEISLRGPNQRLTWSRSDDRQFTLGCEIESEGEPRLDFRVDLGASQKGLRIVQERLDAPDLSGAPLYEVTEPAREYGSEVQVAYNNFARGGTKPKIACINSQAILTQLLTPARFGSTHQKSQREIPGAARRLGDELRQILFLDPSPRLMRDYSFTTEDQLRGDGSNLSAVLYRLIEVEKQKDQVLRFVRSLPEQDITRLSFLDTPRHEVMVVVTETFGRREEEFDAASLSDGTLRTLAVAAALLSVPEGSAVVIEEIDNGVHPSRAELLLGEIQEVIERRRLRVLLTTHNPALLDALPDRALPDVVACYRDPQEGDSRLVRLEDLDRYPELVAQGSLGHLVSRGILDRVLKSGQSREQALEQDLAWLDALQAEPVSG